MEKLLICSAGHFQTSLNIKHSHAKTGIKVEIDERSESDILIPIVEV